MIRPLLPLLLLAGAAPTPATLERPPNILIVLADDLGYGDLRCFDERSRIPTPNLDGLAREGMRFTDAHAPGSWCTPSRYGLLTGRYPCRVEHIRPNAGPVIAEDRTTLPGFLREHGYATAMVGKWHLGLAGEPGEDELRGGPLDRGFERFFGIHASLDIPPYYYIEGREPVAPPSEHVGASATEGWSPIQGAFWRAGAIAPGFEHAEVLPRFTDRAVAWIRELAAGERPFFLYLALASPHTPWLPAEEFRGRGEAGLYGEFVAHTDAAVGRVLDALDEAGVAEDTLVLFTSDNGPVWYPADEERFGHHAAGPWRGMKSDAWEGGHRMPFLVRWPAEVPAGTTAEQTICFTDVLATCAEILGEPVEAPDGHGFLPVLRDPTASSGRTTTVLKANATALREGNWKLITHLGSGGFSRPRRVEPEPDGPTGQLYDLAEDPGETRNLWLERPEVVARLEEKLGELREGGR